MTILSHTERNFSVALIDLDGTLIRGQMCLPGAAEFIGRLMEKSIRPVYFTNNATRTPEQVAKMLQRLSIPASPDEVCTAAQATASILATTHGTDAVVAYVGSDAFGQILTEACLSPISVHQTDFHEQSEAAVAAAVGLDFDVTYRDLHAFCRVVARLGHFTLTNPDARYPVEDGFAPGNGAIASLIQTATGISPIVIGKPQPAFVKYALAKYHATPAQAILIGDNLSTDIAAGNAAGIYTIHVTSGVQGKGSILDANLAHPDEVHDSVDDLFRSVEAMQS